MTIRLNGALYSLPGPLTLAALLERLGIDGRRVAIERNLIVIKRPLDETTMIG